jgi:hypothetical protein
VRGEALLEWRGKRVRELHESLLGLADHHLPWEIMLELRMRSWKKGSTSTILSWFSALAILRCRNASGMLVSKKFGSMVFTIYRGMSECGLTLNRYLRLMGFSESLSGR